MLCYRNENFIALNVNVWSADHGFIISFWLSLSLALNSRATSIPFWQHFLKVDAWSIQVEGKKVLGQVPPITHGEVLFLMLHRANFYDHYYLTCSYVIYSF